jgi:hypothetical protein
MVCSFWLATAEGYDKVILMVLYATVTSTHQIAEDNNITEKTCSMHRSLTNHFHTKAMSILEAMGDFTDIKTLVAVSRCSKQAKKQIAPLLEKKLHNAHEMRQAVLQTFPLIRELPMVDPDHGADYFEELLTRYFAAPARPNLHISHRIGSLLDILPFEPDDRYMHRCLQLEMKSSLGRRRVLECIIEWRRWPDLTHVNTAQRLQKIEDLIHNDFAVISNEIG